MKTKYNRPGTALPRRSNLFLTFRAASYPSHWEHALGSASSPGVQTLLSQESVRSVKLLRLFSKRQPFFAFAGHAAEGEGEVDTHSHQRSRNEKSNGMRHHGSAADRDTFRCAFRTTWGETLVGLCRSPLFVRVGMTNSNKSKEASV